MATRYKHRIGVRAEICFDLILDEQNPRLDILAQAVTDVLQRAADSDGGFALTVLPGGIAYPDWNSVDAEVDPSHVLDSSAIRIFDSVELDSIQ